MLQVKNLICARNDYALFNRLAFSLLPGQALQVVGPNGIGKTTLLRTIAGFLRPMAGQIVTQASTLCFVGHKSGLHPDLSVLENLLFMQTFLAGNAWKSEQVTRGLDYFGLLPKRHTKLGELSAGLAQRLSLTRLLLTPARLWILDEPLANLDTATSKLVSTLCCAHLQNGGAMLFASHHQLDLAEHMVQRIDLGACGRHE